MSHFYIRSDRKNNTIAPIHQAERERYVEKVNRKKKEGYISLHYIKLKERDRLRKQYVRRNEKDREAMNNGQAKERLQQ